MNQKEPNGKAPAEGTPDHSLEAELSLAPWGWSSHWQLLLDARLPKARSSLSSSSLPTSHPARVLFRSRGHYRLQTAQGEASAQLAGRLRQSGEIPAVGDWVVLQPGTGGAEGAITDLLLRRTQLSRKVAGAKTVEQVVAANVDTVFVVMGLDGDFNLPRTERFVVMANQSGAEVVVVLTKADLCPDAEEKRWQVEEIAPGRSVFAVSAPTGSGLAPLAYYLQEGCTVALIGSSGVGKSTLLNHLCGAEVMQTGATREDDDRGRHTTTHRELVRLPNGGMLIDNPGVREIQLWAQDDTSLGDAFSDIEELTGHCRFRNCQHEGEPDCAVTDAIANGTLDARRLEHFRELEREMRFLELRQDDAARRRAERQLGAFYKRVQADKKDRR